MPVLSNSPRAALPCPIRLRFDNRYVYRRSGIIEQPSRRRKLAGTQFIRAKKALAALSHRESKTVPAILFDRLFILRNQISHGRVTWNSGVNYRQIKDDAAISGFLIPLFIDIIMDHSQNHEKQLFIRP